MSRSDAIRDSFERSFGLYHDLLDMVDATALASRLPGLRSNTMGAQLWCVVGARESYARAIAAGGWAGFSCSLASPGDPAEVADALNRSRIAVIDVLSSLDTFTPAKNRLLFDLLEHEAQHQGQLIRFLYALELQIPASWKAGYALD